MKYLLAIAVFSFACTAILQAENNTTVIPIQNGEFCGTSTYGNCIVDTECKTSGCSGQVCQSIFEEDIITTCEYRNCYDEQQYSIECQCVHARCQWT